MSAPRVSVLMPVRNEERFLSAALASLCRQSLTAWELIIVDDGSTDGTPELLRATAAREGDVYGFGCQAGIQFSLRQRGAACVQELFDLLLGLIDPGAHLALLLGIELAQRFQQHCQRAFLAQEPSLCVFQRGGIGSRGETFLRLGDQVVNH